MHQLPAPSSEMCLWGPLPARPAAGVPFQIHEFTHLPEGSTEVILKTHSPTRMKKTCAQSKPFWDLNRYSCIHVVTHVYSFNGQMRFYVSRYAVTTSILSMTSLQILPRVEAFQTSAFHSSRWFVPGSLSGRNTKQRALKNKLKPDENKQICLFQKCCQTKTFFIGVDCGGC